MKKIPLLLVFAVSLFPSYASDTIKVTASNQLIDGSFIESYTNRWSVYFVDSSGNRVQNRHWTDYGNVIELNNNYFLHRVQDLYGPDWSFQSSWTNVVDHSTLLPWKFYTTSVNGQSLFYHFEENQVIFQSNSYAEYKWTSDTSSLRHKVYDWNLFGMLLVGLPFNVGNTYEIEFFDPVQKRIATLFATIEKQEDLTNQGGMPFTTHKFVTNQNLKFWVTKEAPYVIQAELQLPNGTLFWDSY